MPDDARATASATLPDDEALGRRALAGDREAFVQLFGRHERGLLNVAHRLTGSREDAADIAQEAFLRVFARLDALTGRDVNLAAYLHRTARNLVYDRSARRARETPTDELELAAAPDRAPDADPEVTALVSAQGREVQAAAARLPERHRLVLALRELEGMGYEDIGRVLDLTPGAVAQLLARARTALRRELRMEQVDPARMAPACRARLGDIGALIDGELDPDRAQVLTAHLASCEACRAARAGFEEARVTYRAWLPLPVLGLGAATARAAEGRGLVRFADRAGGDAEARGADDAGAGGGDTGAGDADDRGAGRRPRRRRAAAAVAGGVLGLALLIGVPTLVATRSGGSSPPAPAAAPVAATTAATTARPTAPAAAPATTAPATAAAPTGAAPAGAPLPQAAPAAPAAPVAAAARRAASTAAPAAARPPRPARPRTVAPAAAEPPAAPAPPATTAAPPATQAPTTTAAPPAPTTTGPRPRPPLPTGPVPTVIAPPEPPPPVIE